MPLYEHQTEAIEALRRNIRSGIRRQVLMVPTGGGKTRIASEVTQMAAAKGSRILFLADRIELIDQASARFDAEGIDHGVIQGKHWRWRPEKQVQIATIQTLVNRAEMPWDLIFVDECHAGGRRLNDWIQKQNSVVVGLSATPWSKGLGRVYERMVVGVRARELISRGLLVDIGEAWAPTEPDLTGVRVVAGEWEEDGLAKVMDTSRIVGDVVSTWLEKARGRKTFLFAVNVAHSKHMVEAFLKAGVRAAHVDGYEDPVSRKKTIDGFKGDEFELISNVGILDKGVDIPAASCVILARPTKSLMLHIQQLGRVLRIHPGKKDAMVLDHAGNLVRHGFPTDDLPEELDDGKRKPKAEPKPADQLPKICPKCRGIKPKGTHKCPRCGFEPERFNNVTHEEGKLVQIISGQEKRDLYAQIKFEQQRLGKSDSWIAGRFKDLTGDWPRGNIRDVEPKEPTQKVIGKLKSLNIRWANSRARRAAA